METSRLAMWYLVPQYSSTATPNNALFFYIEKDVVNFIFVLAKLCSKHVHVAEVYYLLSSIAKVLDIYCLLHHPPNQYKSEHESDKSKPVHNLALLSTNGHCRVEVNCCS